MGEMGDTSTMFGETSERADELADDREEVRALFTRAKELLPKLEEIYEACSTWAYEDALFRFYHQSFKVHGLERTTLRIVEALRELDPARPLNKWFLEIVEQGTTSDSRYAPSDTRTLLIGQSRWLDVSRPIIEAFFHARFFLEMAVRYAKQYERAPRRMASGWATLLTLYGIR